MLFMVIERFKNRDAKPVYERFAARGRMMPEGLHYVNSWTDASFGTCFQLMETDSANFLDEWIANWNDLVDFEVIPVMSSAEAAEKMKS